jgi:hypothetical protein
MAEIEDLAYLRGWASVQTASCGRGMKTYSLLSIREQVVELFEIYDRLKEGSKTALHNAYLNEQRLSRYAECLEVDLKNAKEALSKCREWYSKQWVDQDVIKAVNEVLDEQAGEDEGQGSVGEHVQEGQAVPPGPSP